MKWTEGVCEGYYVPTFSDLLSSVNTSQSVLQGDPASDSQGSEVVSLAQEGVYETPAESLLMRRY